MRIAVIGAGVVGLSVAYELLRAGHEVRCYESSTPMHARSTGDTRIFRLAHATPDLVEQAMRAHYRWAQWSADAGVRLVGSETTVVSGAIEELREAMMAAGADHRVKDRLPNLPAAEPTGPFLVDVLGGIIQAGRTGRFLIGRVSPVLVRSAATAIDLVATGAAVTSAVGTWMCDSVVIAAGAGTSRLASGVGIDVPDTLSHHARFTFPLEETGTVPPCWIDRSERWRRGITTYAHLAGPGHWAVGGDLPDELTRGHLDPDEVIMRTRKIITDYVAEYLTGVRAEVLDTVYCTIHTGLDDGISTRRNGPVIAIWGNNLFKFAPVLGDALARAAIDSSTPWDAAEQNTSGPASTSG